MLDQEPKPEGLHILMIQLKFVMMPGKKISVDITVSLVKIRTQLLKLQGCLSLKSLFLNQDQEKDMLQL